MLVNCINKKVTASRTFVKGKVYDVRSTDALAGINGDDDNNVEPWFKAASKADSDKFYDGKQKKAHNADKIAEIQKEENKAE